VAEESGFIVAIGDWVLAQAARQARAGVRQGLVMPVSVNVSALQFQQPGLRRPRGRVLRENRPAGELLELELTESILMRDADDALQRLSGARRAGRAAGDRRLRHRLFEPAPT
jgi:EAL domain-containing protein (putative c-di-GMP-specific phosphodiesterase class I)